MGRVERGARKAEIQGPVREAEARVVDEQSRRFVVYVVNDELPGSREGEDCLVSAVAVEAEARPVAASGRLPAFQPEWEPDSGPASGVA